MAAPDVKMWGDEPYYGLGYDFDPTWFLTDEDRALEAEIIDELPARDPAARDRVPTAPPRTRGPASRSSRRLRLLAMIAPTEYGCRGASHVQVLMATEAIARYGCPSTAVIFMMHLVAVGGLVFRAHANPEIQWLLRRMDAEALIGTASYTDPETGGHFWYPKTSGAERVDERLARAQDGCLHDVEWLRKLVPDADHEPRVLRRLLRPVGVPAVSRTRCRPTRASGTRWACTPTSRGRSRSTP